MIWRLGLEALLSYWRRHPGQAVTLILGLALATALWTGVQAINAEARASYDRAADALEQTTRPRLVPQQGSGLPLESYVTLRRAGWQVSPVIEGSLEVGGVSYRLLGLEPLTAPALPRGGGTGGDGLRDFIGPPGQILAHSDTVTALSGSDLPPRVASPDLAPGTLVADIGTATALLGSGQDISYLTVMEGQARDDPALASLVPDLRWQPPREGTDIAGLTRSFHLNLTAFGFLSFAVGLFIAHGAVGLAFEQRQGLFRTLRALGFTASGLAGLLLLEMTLAATVSAGLGVALGYLIAAFLLPDVAATLSGLYGARVPGSIALRLDWVLSGAAITLIGALAAMAHFAWTLMRSPARATPIPRAWARASERNLRRQAIVAAVLILAAIVLGRTSPGLTGAFLLLGLFLMGAALLLPPALALLLALFERRAKGALAQWFWADCRLQLPGLSLALMALLLAVATNIGVGTMVGSFRDSFVGWLDQRLAAELYVNAGNDAMADQLRPALEAETETVLLISSLPASLQGRQGMLYGQPDHPTFRDNWPLISAVPGVWDALAAGKGVIINEQLGYAEGLRPGSQVTIDGADLAVLGIYSDYGNPEPQAIMSLLPFYERHPEAPRHRFALRVAPEDLPQAMAALEAAGLRPDQMTDQARLKEVSRQVFERTFAVTAALNVLTLAVAALAILTALLTLARQRLPQVAPVWAMGLTRGRLGGLEIARSGLLALLTALLALPVGLALAWVLLAIINVEAFGWRLPMSFFPLAWTELLALSLAAALLAAAWPARRLATRPPSELLRLFANER
ncbi:MAG: ABC transporter permease [Pseudomonadota bacterium]